MYSLLAQLNPNPPQPVSAPVHYSGLQYAFAYLCVVIFVVLLIVVLRSADNRMAKPGIVITALLLAMLCSPIALFYLIKKYIDLKNQDKAKA
jgi:hypothetical protein